MADLYELGDRPKRNMEKRACENLPKEESIGTIENICHDEEYLRETRSTIKEKETAPMKVTILRTKKESIIVKAQEDPRKPWYFTHV